MNVFFTSDQHFCHKNIIKYSERPFSDLDEMHRELISRYNEVVRPEDLVYMLGDFAFCNKTGQRTIFEQLNGNKRILPGNHDRSPKSLIQIGFDVIDPRSDRTVLQIGDESVVISHYPYAPVDSLEEAHEDVRFLERRPKDVGGWLLHGHVHEKWKVKRRMINVGVDVWGFRPVSIEQIAELIRRGEQ